MTCDLVKNGIDNPSQQTAEPLLSVVMAARNEARYVASAIQSIISQTYLNWELIIIDDGSIDETSDILEKYSRQDDRIRWIRNSQSLGLAASLNMGIRQARGAIIVRADADDLNMPNRFEEQFSYLRDNTEIDFVGTGAVLINEEGEEIREFFLPSEHEEIKKISFKNTCFFHSSVAMRKSMLERLGLYDETFIRAQDKELWLRGIKYGCRYANISKPLINYRITERSSAYRVTLQTLHSLIRIGWLYKPKWWLRDLIFYVGQKILIGTRLYKPRSLR